MQSRLRYSTHGTAHVAVVACPTICGNRLIHLSQKNDFSWALRDYIANVILRSGKSEMTLSDIEARVTYSEKPTYRSVDRKSEWARELAASSQSHFGSKYDGVTPPLISLGTWKSI
jgi:hypothetical protein